MAIGITNLSWGIGTIPPLPSTPWEQPVITSMGEPLIDVLAVKSTNSLNEQALGYAAWEPFRAPDNTLSCWHANNNFPATLTIITKDLINISKIVFKNRLGGELTYPFKDFKLLVSSDGVSFTEIYNGIMGSESGENTIVNLSYSDFFNYFKFEGVSSYAGYGTIGLITITATTVSSNYTPYTVQSLQSIGVEPASNYEERKEQLATMGVQ